MRPFRPMLAANFKDIPGNHRWPVLATPKFDGIRCITLDGVPTFPGQISIPVCRSLKLVPNHCVYSDIAVNCPPGLDGEIVTYCAKGLFTPERTRNFYEVQSDIMSHEGRSLFKYHVFDYGVLDPRAHNPWGEDRYPYEDRIMDLEKLKLPDFVKIVIPIECNNMEQLEKYEAEQVALGYEGICYRTSNSPYKYGRSTVNEQWLVKMKRMQTSEARIIGMDEEMGNNNPVSYNDLGYAERSSHQENMVGKGRLGALIVRNYDNVEFRIGTGFDAAQRQQIWHERSALLGAIVTYKHQPHGEKDAPRIPVFMGFRGVEDI